VSKNEGIEELVDEIDGWNEREGDGEILGWGSSDSDSNDAKVTLGKISEGETVSDGESPSRSLSALYLSTLVEDVDGERIPKEGVAPGRGLRDLVA